MIVKDEEEVLGRCLDSCKELFDEIVVVDTGSTDKTVEIALAHNAKVLNFDWVDDFALARNFAFKQATSDYIMWLDADDVILEEDLLGLKKRLSNPKFNADTVMLRYNTAFDAEGKPTFSFFRERIFRRSLNPVWVGKVHEVVEPVGNVEYWDEAVCHKKLKPIESGRNLKIYEKMEQEGLEFLPREKFYFARELYQNGNHDKAISVYTDFLSLNDSFKENKIQACLDMSDCAFMRSMNNVGLEALLKALSYGAPKAEACCRIAKYFFNIGDYCASIFWYNSALSQKPDYTSGAFIEIDCYGYIPSLQLCVCYDRLGRTLEAEGYNELANHFKKDQPAYLYNKAYFKTKKI